MESDSSHHPMLTVAWYGSRVRVNIESLAEMKARGAERLSCFCLACDRPLSAKIGRRNRHHFAHRPEPLSDRCWATRPEGEVHLAAKHRLQVALAEACRSAALLTAKLPCPSCTTRDSFHVEVNRLQAGYRVLVECWGDPTKAIKPDLQVVDEGNDPVLFVEVRVTHASAEAKVRLVRESRIPLLEVDGAEVLAQEGTDVVLSCVGHQNLRDTGVCPACMRRSVEEETRRERQRDEREAALKRETARHALSARMIAVRPEAEKRVLRRLEREQAVAGVACCHLHVFVGPRLVAAEKLVVRVTWSGTTTHLALAVSGAGEPFRAWHGTSVELQRIYGNELRDAARAYARALAARVCPDAELETFGGFRADRFREAPLNHVRVPNPDGRGWVTAYPWEALADAYGRERLMTVVRINGWTTMATDDGTTVIAARPVDDYFKRERHKPDFERPSENSDPRWDAMVAKEVRRLVGDAGGRTQGR